MTPKAGILAALLLLLSFATETCIAQSTTSAGGVTETTTAGAVTTVSSVETTAPTVEATGSTTVEATGSTTVEATGSSVKATGSSVEATGSTVEATGSTTVEATGSSVEATGSMTVEATGSTTAEATGSTTVEATGSTTVEATGSTTAEATSSAASSDTPTTAATISATGSSTLSSLSSNTVTPTTASNQSYLISFALLWNGENVTSEAFRQFETLIYPSIKAACPNTARVNTTILRIETVQIDELLPLSYIMSIQDSLPTSNYLFLGMRRNPLTPLFESLVSPTTVPGHPVMKLHLIAPMPSDLLQDALIKAISQRIVESPYPTDKGNYRAAIIIDNTMDITDMTKLFDFFKYGLLFFRYQNATIADSLKEVKAQGIINIIVLLPAAEGHNLKLIAFQHNMLSFQYRWFFHGPRLINDNFDSRMVTHSLNITSLEFGRVRDTMRLDLRTTSAVLVYDLLSIWKIYLKRFLCDEAKPVNTTYRGFSGLFKLDPDGTVARQTWQLEIYRGLEANRKQIGEWSSDGIFDMLSYPDPPRTPEIALKELRLNPFRMVTFDQPPYVSFKPGVPSDRPLKERLTGMYIELCKEILSALEITNYEFFLQEDQAFGVFTNNSWNGMVRTMIDGRAHLTCAPVTVETSRREVVSFTKVVHTSPQSIIYKTPPGDPINEMFQFLQPLDSFIWLTVLGVLVFVAIVLCIMHAIIPNKDAKLTFYHSLFFSFAEVVQGTSGAVPNQLSGRIVVLFFWFFTLFLLLTYIANYAAFRLLAGVQNRVESLETLLQSSDFEFGVINNTVTVTLLQSSSITYMQQIYMLISDTFQNGLVGNTSAAVQIMQNDSQRYALISDYLQNEYLTETNCNLVNTGQFYQLKSALMLPKHNEYGVYFDEQITALFNRIQELQANFFQVGNDVRPDCTDRSFLGYVKMYTPANIAPTKEGALTLTNTLGIAMINLFGCIFALLLSGLERSFSRFLQKRSDVRRQTQVSEAYEMAQRPTMLE